MISKRIDALLALAALVVSFVAVFAVGRLVATADEDGRPGMPDPNIASPSPTTADTSPVPRSRIQIVIVDLNADQPAPGLLELRPQDATHPRRVCMVPALMQSWVPQSMTDWAEEGGTLCRVMPPNTSGALELTWVLR